MAEEGGSGGVGVRLFVAGAALVKATFSEIAASGKKMWAEIAAGGKSVNPALRAISAGSTELQNALKATAAEAGGLGRALANAGAAGIAVAAALGGAMIALRKTGEALDWAEKLDNDAKKLQISAKSLQEWRFAAQEATGDSKNFDTALQGLEDAVGKVQGKIGRYKIVEDAFKKIGISPEDIRSFSNAADMIDLVSKKLDGVGQAEKRAFADKFGLGPILPLLEAGADKTDAFRAQAQKLGLVIDNTTVKSMAELSRESKIANEVIGVQLRQAFLSLGPVLVDLANLLAKLSVKIANFFTQFQDSTHASEQGLAAMASKYQGNAQGWAQVGKWGSFIPGLAQFAGDRSRAGSSLSDAYKHELIMRHMADDASEPTLSLPKDFGADAKKGGGGRKSAAETENDRLLKVNDEIEAATIKSIDARIKSATDAKTKLDLELQKLSIEADKNAQALAAKVKDYQLSHGKRGVSPDEARYIAGAQQQDYEASSWELQRRYDLQLKTVDLKRQEGDLEERIKLAELAGAKASQQQLEDALRLVQLTAEFKGDGQSDDQAGFNAYNMVHNEALSRIQGELKVAGPTGTGPSKEDITAQKELEKREMEAFSKDFATAMVSAIDGAKMSEVWRNIFKRAAVSAFEDVGNQIWKTLGAGLASVLHPGSPAAGAGSSFMQLLFGGGHAAGGAMGDHMKYRAAEGGATELALIGGSGHVFGHQQAVDMIRDAVGGASGARGGNSTVHHVQVTQNLKLDGYVPSSDLMSMFRQMHDSAASTAIEHIKDNIAAISGDYQMLKG